MNSIHDTLNFMHEDALASRHEGEREREEGMDEPCNDCHYVREFASAMLHKLEQKAREGRGGWNTSACTNEFLARELVNHVLKGDPVDIANFCMMLYWRNGRDAIIREAQRRFKEAAHAEREEKDGNNGKPI